MSMAQLKNLALGVGLSVISGTFACAQGAAAPAATAPAASPSTASSPAPTGRYPPRLAWSIFNRQSRNALKARRKLTRLQQRFSPKQVELKQLSDDVENLKKQYQAQGDKLSDEEKSSRAKAIDTKQKALQRNYEDAQAEFQQAEQDVINRIGSKMVAVLEKYANANGFAVVLDVSNPQTSPVLWATQGTVITKELVDAYDKENPAGATAAKPAGAAKPPAPRPAATPARPATASPTPKKP